MKTTGQIIGESDGEYRKYLQNLVNGQKLFIAALEDTAQRIPSMAQEIAGLIADNNKTLVEYQARLRRELSRALSSKKD